MTGFNGHSYAELMQALEDAKGQGMRGLVLDLRYNPGGLLDIVVREVGAFLPQGVVVSTRGRAPGEIEQVLEVPGGAQFADLPMVVLVNDGSASASEILAGSLQDHHRALILGERTFGKGSVQRVLPLGPQARLKLTTALYYLPSGRSPHKARDAQDWGVDPDRELKLTPKEELKVFERERESYIITNENGAKKPTLKLDEEARQRQLEALKAKKASDDPDAEEPLLTDEDVAALTKDPYEAPDVDPQLEDALLLLRAKLAANMPWPARSITAQAGGDAGADKP
jgi:carboxyl-terminal processing protease